MSRYRVEVSTCSVYFIEARDAEAASQIALDGVRAGIRPDYKLEPVADVDAMALDSTGAAA